MRAAIVLVLVAACGGGRSKQDEVPHQETISNTQPAPSAPAPAAQTPTEMAMAKMREFRDKLCACHDTACVQVVSDDMTKWSQEMAQKADEPVNMTEADQKAATEIGTQMGECMQKAMAAGSGAAP